MFLLLSKVVLFLNCCRGMRDFALRALKHLQLPLKSSLEAAPLSARGSIIGHGWEKNSVCSLPGLQMHHPEQGTPLWPDCLFPCLILPNKREDRKEIRAPERSKICPLCPAEPALTSHGRKPRAMVTALLGLGHSQQTHLGFKKYIPLPFSVFCSLCFSSSLQFQKLTRGFGLEFGVYLSPYQQLCCDPVSQLSLSSRYSLLCSLLRKTFPAWYNPIYSPSSELPWATKEKGIIPVSQAGCEALGEAGSWVPAPWEIRLCKQNLVTSSFKGGTVPWSQQFNHLSPSGKLTRAASGICNQQKGAKISNLTNSYHDWKIN